MNIQAKPMNIFLAVDGSEHCQIAAETICSLSFSPNSKVTALAVLDTPHTLRRQLLLNALDKVKECFVSKGIAVETGLLHGNPAEALTMFSDEHKPDLIVLGAKGLRATLGILLGGVAQQVIEHTHWPVLIVRPPYKPINKVLLATDGSMNSQAALEYLKNFPLPKNVEVHVVYVVPPMPEYQIGSLSHIMLGGSDSLHPIPIELIDEAENWQVQLEERGNSILQQSKALLDPSGFVVKTELLNGDAATEILNYCENKDIDLIIAGSRGLSQVRGWLLGSVSRKLVHYSHCSVLIVRE